MSTLNTNFPILSVERTIETLSNAYCTVIEKGVSPKALPSVMLWGPPGVGKSQAVRQIAKDIEFSTGKSVRITDVRLLLFNPIDLRGIPTSNADKTLAIWLKPQIFQMDDSEDVINILFLDEISAAPQSVQAAAYQITLDRVVGEHRLPDNCIVIAAGNRITDKSVSFKMPKALANRLLHIEVEGSYDSWHQWAVRSGIHEKVLGFLSFRSDRLFGFDATNDDLAFATPRSWEMVSSLLNHVGDDVDKLYPMIAGLVGSGIAIEFRSWCRVYSELPCMEDIFAGRTELIPKGTDGMYAVVSSMTVYARDHKNDLFQIGNSIHYARRLPADFGMLLMDNYLAMEKNYKDTLMQIPEYVEYASAKGMIRNGSVR
ncbi:MAG: AAA family ATPase [Oscillospiraceae bacterium]|nr:AAA family ATPase [Oscillospiraceae bacterium]